MPRVRRIASQNVARGLSVALTFAVLERPQQTVAQARYDAQPAVMGLGTASCADFNSWYRNSPVEVANAFFDWTQGFMSGLNVRLIPAGQPTNLRPSGFPFKDQEEAIRSYCLRHPHLPFSRAATDLWLTLRRDQGLPPALP